MSGDSAVAYSWAYCQALEGLAGCTIPPRAAWLRGLVLEAERIANHLGDLGALGNDAGFAFGLAQFSRLKEHWLRAVERALRATLPDGCDRARRHGRRRRARRGAGSGGARRDNWPHEVRALRQIYEEHDGVRDRFATTGSVSPALAARLGIIGLAGRASGQAYDARVDWPMRAIRRGGAGDRGAHATAMSRRGSRCASTRSWNPVAWSRASQAGCPDGPSRAEVAAPTAPAFGVGVVEGWRGPVLVALDAGPGDRVLRCHPHDPSWQNWPALEHAVIGNIVPDFPLINKSFNLSYSGHDL